MTGKTHIVAGTLTGIVLADRLVNDVIASGGDVKKALPLIAVIGSASILGSIIPDIDINDSIVSKLLFPFRFIYWFFSKVFSEKWFKHRGITHTLCLPLLCILLIMAFYQDSFSYVYIYCSLLGIFFGVISHFTLDMLNPAGIPLLGPICKRNFRLMPKFLCITTGTMKEKIFFGLLFIVSLIWITFIIYGWIKIF